jgi:ubiquitin carboxyl-terminal hydrolase 6/32
MCFSSDDSLGYEFPFTLKAVNSDGSCCAWCKWYDFCRGCTIPPTDVPFSSLSGSSAEDASSAARRRIFYLAIDWDPTAIHLRYQPGLERAFDCHESVARTEKEQNEPISLERCLEAFTKEEELGENEKYFCTHCKCHQLAKIKLEIWRLPPILVRLRTSHLA